MANPPPSFESFPDLDFLQPSVSRQTSQPAGSSRYASDRGSPFREISSRDRKDKSERDRKRDRSISGDRSERSDQHSRSRKHHEDSRRRDHKRDRKRDGRREDEREVKERRSHRDRRRSGSPLGSTSEHRHIIASTSSSSKYHDTSALSSFSKTTRDKQKSDVLSLSSSRPAHSDNEPFYIDRRGDRGNIQYGSMDQNKLARYRRSGAGEIVGFPKGFKITQSSARNGTNRIEVEWHRGGANRLSMRYSDKTARSLLSLPSHLIVKPSTDTNQSIPTQLPAYLPFSKKPSKRSAPKEKNQDDSSKHYRSILSPSAEDSRTSSEDESENDQKENVEDALQHGVFGKLDDARSDDQPSGDEDEDSESDPSMSSREALYREKNISFAKRLKETPLVPSLWLEFARFSSEAEITPPSSSFLSSSSAALADKNKLDPSLPIQSTTTHHSRQTVILSHLTKALDQYPVLGDDLGFTLALMEAAEEVESARRVDNRWDRILEGPLARRVEVWRRWGDWRMRGLGGRGEEEDLGGGWAEEGLRRVRIAWEKTHRRESTQSKGFNEKEDLEGIMVYLVLRGCLAMKEAGYIEQATAVFQAQMELTFFTPSHLQTQTFQQKLDALATFWDSEAPRFGESSSVGWAHTPSSPPLPPPSPSPPSPLPAFDSSQDSFIRWSTAENLASSSSYISARLEDPPWQITQDTTDEADPFKPVLFQDIRSFLVPIYREACSVDRQVDLIYALFAYLDLPFTPPDASTSAAFFSDPFLAASTTGKAGSSRFWPEHLTVDKETKKRKLLGDGGVELEVEGGVKSPWGCPVKVRPVGVADLFRRESGQGGFPIFEKAEFNSSQRTLISNILFQVRTLNPDPIFSLYAFSFEAAHNVKSAIKLAKPILAENRDSLPLWDGYARLERQRSKPDESRKVYLTALSMMSKEVVNLHKAGRGQSWVLWRGWAELEWEWGVGGKRLIEVIASATNAISLERLSTPPTAALDLTSIEILKTRQFFSGVISSSLSPEAPTSLTQNTTHLIFLSALFEYLTIGLEAAADVFERHLDSSLMMSALEKEEIYLLYTDLLYKHTLTPSPYRPALIRSVLERAITIFPHNTSFLSLYALTEMRLKFYNRARKMLETTVLSGRVEDGGGDVNGWLFAIWLELSMTKGRHNEHAVRRLFERAFDKPGINSSVTLWRLAINHEILLGQGSRGKALFFRAINACPWSKELYILPFGPLRSHFTTRELEETYDLLHSRKIRLRIPIEPFLVPSDFQHDQSSDSDGGNEDDVKMEEGPLPRVEERFGSEEMHWEREEREYKHARIGSGQREQRYEIGEDERRLIEAQKERERLMPY
ncbi:Uncharacterized conserved protein [Phaffia rhodozyma]|uniref:Uncharacterized conserved protein n=1 Tax=Phaffia rhodozyma TaxID=264483 RepID=A0A0F7SXF0_PHARH|nr:Uncharacterized conserved protein [Phaffia rhodozyma]